DERSFEPPFARTGGASPRRITIRAAFLLCRLPREDYAASTLLPSNQRGDAAMEHYYAELVGVAAAAASLYAAHAKTMIPLRVAAIAANFLAMIYSFMHGTYPTFLLNVALLPLNGVRLQTMLKLLRAIAIPP